MKLSHTRIYYHHSIGRSTLTGQTDRACRSVLTLLVLFAGTALVLASFGNCRPGGTIS